MKTAPATNKTQKLALGTTELAGMKAGKMGYDANVKGSLPTIRIGEDGTVIVGSGGIFVDLSINAG